MSGWDSVSEQYSKTFGPKFHLIYDEIVSNTVGKKVLDYGTGHGQPAHTWISKNDYGLIVMYDPSIQMLELAKQNTTTVKKDQMEMYYSSNEFQKWGKFDTIMSSLALMYVDDLDDVLKQFRSSLNENGRICCSYWGHHTKVPSLYLLKRINREIVNGFDFNMKDFELDDTFKLASERTIRRFEDCGFQCTKKSITIKIEYSNALELVEFININDSMRTKAKILLEQMLTEMGIDYTKKFSLDNECIILVATKID